MTHRLVLVAGTSFGAGKTVLAAGLADALNRRGIQARVLEEDTLLAAEPFARFDREIGDSDPAAMTTLLEAARWLASLEYDLLVLNAEAAKMQQIGAVLGRLRVGNHAAP